MANRQIKLAEALLRRKELQEKVQVLKTIRDKDLFEVKCRRQNIAENIDEVIAQVPKLDAWQVTHEFDWHSRRLRMIDSIIQQANWITEIKVDPTVMADYESESQGEPKPKLSDKAPDKPRRRVKTEPSAKTKAPAK